MMPSVKELENFRNSLFRKRTGRNNITVQYLQDFQGLEGSKPSLTDRQNLVNRMINEGLIKEYTAEKVTDNSLPWLAKFENPADNPNQNKQIAANIVDFFTESTEPTSNLTDADWSKAVESNTAPEYTGLKKTSYISGIGVDIKLDATQEVTPIADTTNFTHTYHISRNGYADCGNHQHV